jgi:hypothetical protein
MEVSSLLSIKFTKKDRSVDQQIDRATIGPRNVAFVWRHEGKDGVLDLPKAGLQMLIDSIEKGVKEPISCSIPQNPDRGITVQIDGDCVNLDFAEKGTTKTVRLSVKSLLVLKAFLAEK